MDLFTENLVPAIAKMWCKHVNLSQAYFQVTIFARKQSVGICFVAGKYMHMFTPHILYQTTFPAKSTMKINSGLKPFSN